jgi:hypothetical protein
LALNIFNNLPLTNVSEVGLIDTFIGDGVTKKWFLVNNTATTVGSIAQIGNLQFFSFTNGFTVSSVDNSITFPIAAGVGVQIVVPSQSNLTAVAFDQPVIPGVTNPRVSQVGFYVSDINTINLNTYEGLPSSPGIGLTIVNLLSSFGGADSSWCQFASSDFSGNMLTPLATGTSFFGPSITAIGSFLASSAPGASSLMVSNASSFNLNGYSIINFGNATAEYVHVIGTANNNQIFISGSTNYTHTLGEVMYDDGYKLWLQTTVPLNASNNTAVNLFNCGIQLQCAVAART